MSVTALPLLIFCLTVITACQQSVPHAVTHQWPGRWNGPEGTYLDLGFNADGNVSVVIADLDGPQNFKGRFVGDAVQFSRGGRVEIIRAASGPDTGMKWLLDKKDCLLIRPGEGYCRD